MGPIEEGVREQARLEARDQLLTLYRAEWNRRRRELMRAGLDVVTADERAQRDTVRAHLEQYASLREQRYQELSAPRPGRKPRDRNAELAVDCVACRADVGEWCRSKTGRRVDPHASRLRRVGLEPVWVREDVVTDF